MTVTPQTNTTLSEIASALAERDHFVIGGHVSPDGDCLGSALGLAWALRQLGKPLGLLSDMYLPGDFLQQLVEEAGFGPFACCLVSGEEGVSKGGGGLYQRWKGRFLPDAPLAHVGDNPHADGEMARAPGIVPMLYPGVHQAGGPYRARDMSAVVGSLYRGVVNGQLHNGSQAYSPLY